LKARAVQAVLRRLTLKLVAEGKIRYPYSPHDYRHRFAANLYYQTRDVLAVQEALGHASLEVTQIYLTGLGALE
jgi:integrase/recombinase XerD